MKVLKIALMIVALFFLLGSAKSSEESTGIVSYLEGNAQKTQIEAERWNIIRSQDPLRGGEKVKTLNESRAELKLDVGKVIRMAPLTEVDILKLYKEVTESGKRSDMKIKLSEGQIYSKIDSLDSDEFLEIETPFASATIRGTVFLINCESADKVEFDVLNGEVWVYSNDITDPYEYFKNMAASKTKKPFKRIEKPFHRVTREQWMEIVKSMQRITITKDGKKEMTDLDTKDLDDEWIKWNKEFDKR